MKISSAMKPAVHVMNFLIHSGSGWREKSRSIPEHDCIGQASQSAQCIKGPFQETPHSYCSAKGSPSPTGSYSSLVGWSEFRVLEDKGCRSLDIQEPRDDLGQTL